MTVHGAKGLQAPIVFMPDTVSMPSDRDPVRWFTRDGAAPVPLWLRDRSRDHPVCTEAREQSSRRMIQEYHRLLYVAMTRAEDRLYIAGAKGGKEPPDGCWFCLIEAGLDGVGAEVEDPEIGSVKRISCPQLRAAEPADAPSDQPIAETLPAWARRPAPAEPRPPQPLAPSRPEDADVPASSPLDRPVDQQPAQTRARDWGVAAHRLLQRLPDVTPERRAGVAAQYLATNHGDWPEEHRAALVDEVMSIIDHPDYAALFGPGSLAEVPLVAVLDDGRVVAGQVDRLLAGEDSLLVVDYKTNRHPPQDVKSVPPAYLRQMAAYRAALAQLFSDRPIHCALLWTDGPKLMPLPPESLDFAISGRAIA